MADLQFDTNQNEFGAPPQQSQGFDLTGQIVGLGLASDRKQAEYILIGIGAFALLVAAYFMFSGGGPSVPPPPVAA